jgi:hypothetical protein
MRKLHRAGPARACPDHNCRLSGSRDQPDALRPTVRQQMGGTCGPGSNGVTALGSDLATDEPQGMQARKVSRRQPAGGLTVLVVTADERQGSRICGAIRRDRRFRLLGSVGSYEELESDAKEPNVALVDLLVPELSAPASLAAYKRRHPRSVVAVWSDLDVPYLRSVGRAAGADAYLVLGPTDRRLTDFLAALAHGVDPLPEGAG